MFLAKPFTCLAFSALLCFPPAAKSKERHLIIRTRDWGELLKEIKVTFDGDEQIRFDGVSAPTASSGENRYLSFRLPDGRYARLGGLEIELRYRAWTLLGEPVEVAVAQLTWSDSPFLIVQKKSYEHDGWSVPYDHDRFLLVEGKADAEEISIRPAASSDSFVAEVPLSLFEEQITVLGFWYSLKFGPLYRNYDGVISPYDEWGWNVAGSPSWDEFRQTATSLEGRTNFPSEDAHNAKKWFKEQADSNDEERYRGTFYPFNLDVSASGLLFALADQSEPFRSAYFGKSDAAQISALVSSALYRYNEGETGQKMERRARIVSELISRKPESVSETMRQEWEHFLDEMASPLSDYDIALADDLVDKLGPAYQNEGDAVPLELLTEVLSFGRSQNRLSERSQAELAKLQNNIDR